MAESCFIPKPLELSLSFWSSAWVESHWMNAFNEQTNKNALCVFHLFLSSIWVITFHQYFFYFDLLKHFSYLPKFYPEFPLLSRPWCSNHTLHAMHLNSQWLKLVPGLIFPVSIAASLIAFDRSQSYHITLGLLERLKMLPQTQIFGGWARLPLPYETFHWR